MNRVSSSQHKLRSATQHLWHAVDFHRKQEVHSPRKEVFFFYAFLWHSTNPVPNTPLTRKKSFSRWFMRMHTRTGTIQMFKPAPAWVFFKTCNFTHLNALLPRCVWVTVWHKEGYFYPSEPEIRFPDSPREIQLPELSHKPFHTCVNTCKRDEKS